MTTRTKAPPVQRLEHWTLVASDVERSKQWYMEVLGAGVPRRDGPTCVTLAGTIIDLFPNQGDRSPSPGSWGQHHSYIIKVEDYDAFEEMRPIVVEDLKRDSGYEFWTPPDTPEGAMPAALMAMHAAHTRRGIADLQSDVIPRFCQVGRKEFCDPPGQVSKGERILSCAATGLLFHDHGSSP